MVLGKLEEARVAKLIGSSLEARVMISAGSYAHRILALSLDQLRYVFIVSQVDLSGPDPDLGEENIKIAIDRAPGQKCERCWNYSTRVGESSRYPSVCERCVEALEEIEREIA